MRTYIQIKTEDLSGRALEWAVLQPESDQPKTYGCHHNMPTCMHCEWLVKQWLIKELGPMIDVPEDI